MKFALFAAVGLALALVPAAAAQDMCATFRAVMDKAPERFDSFRGEQLASGVFKSTAEVPPFKNCRLADKRAAVIVCSQTGASESEASGAYDYLAKQVRNCFPSWSPS